MLKRLSEWLLFNSQRELIHWRFRRTVGYAGDFENPITYQEKLQFRKLYGNHQFYASVADKYRVRRYVAERVGEQYLIPLLGVYDRLDRSVFEGLPQQFIIKANHGCKWHQVVWDKSKLDIDQSVRRFNRLCRKRFGWRSGERHYSFIEPKIVIEQLLIGPDGGLPYDYSFFCYNGPTGFDYNFAIVSSDGRDVCFSKDWTVFEGTWTLLEGYSSVEELIARLKPQNFDTMVRVARELSAEFDFVRVDLYTVESKVYFGELTCTPHQGYFAIDSAARQQSRDRMWQLAADNPRLYRPPGSHRRGRADSSAF